MGVYETPSFEAGTTLFIIVLYRRGRYSNYGGWLSSWSWPFYVHFTYLCDSLRNGTSGRKIY